MTLAEQMAKPVYVVQVITWAVYWNICKNHECRKLRAFRTPETFEDRRRTAQAVLRMRRNGLTTARARQLAERIIRGWKDDCKRRVWAELKGFGMIE